MVKALILILVLGVLPARAVELPVKVLNARYNLSDKTIDVMVKHQGDCNEQYILRVRGCTDLFMPYTCFADFQVHTFADEICEKDTQTVVRTPLKKLGLDSSKFTNSTVIIKGTNSEAKVVLRNH